MRSKVLFTPSLSAEAVVGLYEALGHELPGRIAVKLHSGEEGNQNYLRPEFWKPMICRVHGTVVECNTAYPGERDTTEKHLALLRRHGWTAFPVDLLDAQGQDLALPVRKGRHLRADLVGAHLADYDSLLVLSHFKGHPVGGYGGALKQLSIGCASSAGKARIHSAGATDDPACVWEKHAEQLAFCESMAEAASAVTDLFGERAVYINVLKNLSVDCDCCAVAEDPCMRDLGMMASLDPVALDRACLDLIYAAKEDAGQKHFLERVESRHGSHTIEAAESLGIGTCDYELTEVKL